MAYQRSPQNQQTLNKSLSLFQSGRADKAEKLARSVLATEPRNAELLQFVAMLCQSQDKFADAVALGTKAVAIDPHSAEAQYNLGTALMKQGRNAQAVASLETSLALAPSHYDALNNLAVALTAADRAAEAEQAAKRAIAMAPGGPLAHNSLGLALAKQMRLAEAAQSFEAALARGHPDPAHVLDKLSLVYIHLERPNAAIDSLRKALVHKPKALDITMRLGGMQILANKHLDALQPFQAATQLAPQDPSPWVGYVFSCLHASEWAEYGRLVAKTEKKAGLQAIRVTIETKDASIAAPDKVFVPASL